MRNPNRIPKILARLQKLWEKYPDMRLGQLIENRFINIETKYVPSYSAYYVEDEKFISELEKFYKTELVYRKGGKKDLQKLIAEFSKK